MTVSTTDVPAAAAVLLASVSMGRTKTAPAWPQCAAIISYSPQTTSCAITVQTTGNRETPAPPRASVRMESLLITLVIPLPAETVTKTAANSVMMAQTTGNREAPAPPHARVSTESIPMGTATRWPVETGSRTLTNNVTTALSTAGRKAFAVPRVFANMASTWTAVVIRRHVAILS
ncbi:hypothetical protein F4778DRAFT_696388 [Xylariomycetidae sp. FL2044]|nr:hypothetical protein F4778DRAFT_696388 [Xylariomycetidae sp. FL2044]